MLYIKQSIRIILWCIAYVMLGGSAYAATTPWAVEQNAKARLVVGGEENNTLYAGVEIIAKPGWKLYWRTPGDAGFPPMFDWTGSGNIRSFDVKWPVPERDIQSFEGGAIESYVYHDRLLLPVLMVPDDPAKNSTITLRLDYGVCKEICIPVTAEFALDIPAHHTDAGQLEAIKQTLASIPQPNAQSTALNISRIEWVEREGKHYIEVQAKAAQPLQQPDLFIETKAMFKFSAPRVERLGDTQAILYSEVLPTVNKTASLKGNEVLVTLADGNHAVEEHFVANTLASAAMPTPSMQPMSWGVVLWLAFLGGLILNVMPCVLPVLSIKLLTILQQGGAEMHDVRRGFVASALGIITSFIVLAGVTIAFKETGQAVGWGFHFQNPSFLIVLVVILVLFASNLIGRFEINLPGGVADFLIHKTPMKYQSVAGDFIAGIFATILATPCTAPFLGTAISFALSRGAMDIVIIFITMGIGLAFPYIIFSLFPRWVTKLPKPGAWMVKVKYVLAILLALTAIWLLWVLSHNLGMRAAVVVFLAALLIKFFVELKAKGIIRIAGMLAVLAIVFTVPFAVTRQDTQQHAMAGRIWVPFDEAAIPQLVKEGKVVFVDVTADWCLTCKYNKMLVLERMDVMKHFEALEVVAMKADITKPRPEIMAYLKKYNRYGIPFNIVYGPAAPEGIPLSELLTVSEVNQGLARASGKKPPEK